MSFTFTIYGISATALVLLFLAEAWTDKRNFRSLYDVLKEEESISSLNFKHLYGIIIMGSVSAFWFSFTNASLLTNPFPENKWWLVIILASATALITGYSSAKKLIPAITFSSGFIPPASVLTYFLFRALFLTAYEFFFRAVLLFSIINDAGERMAIAINILLYMLLHIFSGRKELIGTIPFGLLLCSVTVLCQSVWPAVIIHLCLALSHELTLIMKKYSSPKLIKS